MKRIICAVIAAGLMAAGPLAARARADEGGKDEGRRGERVEKALKERLGLSDDQAAKLKAAYETEKTAVKGLREQAKAETRKLEEEVRDLAPNKDIEATLDQLDAGRKAMQAEHAKMESSVASILKPDQRARLRLMMGERMKRRGEWGRGGHEGREACGGERHRDGKGGEDRRQHDD